MKGLKRCIAVSFAAWLLTAGAAWAYDDVTAPTSSLSTTGSTTGGPVLIGLLGDTVDGYSTDGESLPGITENPQTRSLKTTTP